MFRLFHLPGDSATALVRGWRVAVVMMAWAVLARAAVSYEAPGSFQKPGTEGVAPLVRHSDGDFYGVAQAGGSGGNGTVFKMTPAGAVTTLVSFTGDTGTRPGAEPVGPLAVSGLAESAFFPSSAPRNSNPPFDHETNPTTAFVPLDEAAGRNPSGGLVRGRECRLLEP